MALNDENISIWIRLRDSARFRREMQKNAAATTAFGRTTSRVSGIAAAGLMALGRAGIYATGALAAGGAAVAALGVKYNATMEQNEVAFANFLGSQQRAKVELQWLEKFAARSPFEFPELVAAERKLLAFGMSSAKARETLGSVGEAAAGLGLAGPDIQRMVMALGQIQAKGKLSTEELLQMAELGVPAFAILKKELGLTGKQLEKQLRDGAISADKGIGVLLKGMDERFKGSMKDQSKTFLGQLSTLKDETMTILGDLTKPLFNWAKDSLLPGLNAAMPSIKAGAPAAFAAIGDAGAEAFAVIKPVVEDLIGIIGQLVELGIDLKPIWGGALYLAFMLLSGALDLVNDNFDILLAAGAGLATYAGLIRAWSLAATVATFVTGGWTVAFWKLNAAMLANPFGAVFLVLALLVTGFVLAYKKSETFRRVVGAAFDWVKQAAIDSVQGIIWVLDKMMGAWSSMLSALGKVPGFGWAKDAANAIDGARESLRSFANGLDRLPTVKELDVIVNADIPRDLTKLLDSPSNMSMTPPVPLKRRSGGPIPGTGRGDRVPLWAEPGEYVVQRSVVETVGMQFMNDLNRGIVPAVVPDDQRPVFGGGAGRGRDLLPVIERVPPPDTAPHSGDTRRTIVVKTYLGKRQLAESVVEDAEDELARR